ncbi:hypothetical protein [Chryseobacterium gleum]|uniref:hypothetical protein n=1 Tax=Chryseobacterium gleum TaxID=250 RepID=UPI001E4E1CA8|nr:hypothetical protein [Chryseobacterium gleum]MCD9619031.1 hypothetical protein [Chryseobacterium gleum]
MMKKNLKLFAYAIGFIFLFYACRTDEMVNSEQRAKTEKIAAFERFENLRSQEILNKKTHSSKNGDQLPLSYAQPFSEIIYQFLVKHPDFYNKLADDFGEIDYNVASQTFGEDKKYIFYPILKDGKVTSLWYGKLNEDRSWVDFYLVHDTSASTKRMIGEFQNYYSKKALNRGEPDPPVKEIPEIIITPPSTNPPIHDPIPSTGGDGNYTPPYTGDMSGGPIIHGGGTGNNNNQNSNPCSKIKKNLNDARFQEKVSALNTSTVLNYDHEMGFAAAYPPIGTGLPSQYQPMENKIGTHSVRLPDGDRYFGFIHTHNNEDGVVKIFSPADVATFLTSCVPNSHANGNYGDAYAMVITSEGSYMLQYTGTNSIGIASNTLANWKDEYKKLFQALSDTDNLTQSSVEKAFAQFLKDVVKVPGLEVYKIEGTVSNKLNLDSNNNIVKIPCP